MANFLNVAVEGCCHGELDTIYQAIAENERRTRRKVDLLLVCGDFECVRDIVDLECLAVPLKYRKLNSFHQYVTGEKVAPVTTIFVGGNHEASNVLQSLYYGGWVAPKIYFMGFGGVVNFRGLRIAGLSGIFHQRHYRAGHFETPPYSEDTLRSVYHMRELEVYRMAHMVQSDRPVDVFLSHDWPAGIWDYGNRERLLKLKPYFREDMQSGKLGNPPLMHLLMSVKPSYWFAAHLHVKFAATVVHPLGPGEVPAGTAAAALAVRQARPPPPPTPPVSLSVPIALLAVSDDGGSGSSGAEEPAQGVSDANTAQAHSPRPPSTTSTNTSTEDSHSSRLGKRSAGQDALRGGQYSDNEGVQIGTGCTSMAPATPKEGRVTQFLALDKVLPGREFLQFLQIPVEDSSSYSEELEFDPEWLAVLRRTHTLLKTQRGDVHLPQQVDKVSEEDVTDVRRRLVTAFGSLRVPLIAPYTPVVVIAGECIPPRHNPSQQPGGDRAAPSAAAGARLSTSTGGGYASGYASASASGGGSGYDSADPAGYSSGYASSTSHTSRSGLNDLHFTKESYAQQVAMEMRKLQQEEMLASGLVPPVVCPPGPTQQGGDHYGSDHYGGGRGGRGGRGRGGGGGRGQEQHSYYGPGGAASHNQQAPARHYSGGGKKGHGMLFNPTSRVTPLGNVQTDDLLRALGLSHIWTRPCEDASSPSAVSAVSAVVSASAPCLPRPPLPPLPPSAPPGAPALTVPHGVHSTAPVDSRAAPMHDHTTRSTAPPTITVPPTVPATISSTEDAYGFNAYYGAGVQYYKAETGPVVDSTTLVAVAAPAGSDPLEIDIDDNHEAATEKIADPQEVDIDGHEPAHSVDADKDVDPNMIDLDF